ncbi:hypothetical protein CD934_07435 [Streptomyces calvus]|uniref:Uncharacterized protein n=1 Tax=Streptomyces calvus TaxID=67282 RepID=A0A514JMH6_9ACTN|nr:hypothetical protein CD934_07435 [Streptomyces calvus]
MGRGFGRAAACIQTHPGLDCGRAAGAFGRVRGRAPDRFPAAATARGLVAWSHATFRSGP